MRWAWCLLRVFLMLGLSLSGGVHAHQNANICDVWQELPYAALRQLDPCGEPPVQRRIQSACVRHEWLCGRKDFGGWFTQWAEAMDSPIRLELIEGQMIFSSEHDDQAWAIFLNSESVSAQGFVLLLSRIRAAVDQQ